MEIIIKTKQSNNPQFSFLSFEDPLNVYYRFLVEQIKCGSYVPVPDTKQEDSDDDDDDYLHPSLFAAKPQTPFTVPKLYRKDGEDDAYSWLVRNLREKVQHSNPSSPPAQSVPTTSKNSSSAYVAQESSLQETVYQESYQQPASHPPPPGMEPVGWMYQENEYIVPPPPDIEPIIDKMAVYVAKNGEDFETIVKSKGDKRFEFLLPSHKYYPYYLYKKQMYQQEKQQEPQPYGPEPQPQNEQDKVISEETEQEPLENVPEDMKEENGTELAEEDGVPMDVVESKVEVPENIPEQAQPSYISDLKVEVTSPLAMSPQMEGDNSMPAKIVEKVPKGPVSFSLKPKEAETLEKKRVVLAESDSEGDYLDSILAEAEEPKASSRVSNVDHSSHSPRENKIHEEKDKRLEELKDRLCAAVREKMSHSRQLQLERKRKAAQFLSMLKQTPSLGITCQSDQGKKSETTSINKSDDSSILLRRSPTDSLPSSPTPRPSKDRSRSPDISSRLPRNRTHRRSPSPPSSRRHRRIHHRPSSRHRSRSPSPPHRHQRYDRHRTPPHSYSKSKRSRTRTPSPRRKSRSSSKDRSRRK